MIIAARIVLEFEVSSPTGLWRDANCGLEFPFVCRRECGGKKFTPAMFAAVFFIDVILILVLAYNVRKLSRENARDRESLEKPNSMQDSNGTSLYDPQNQETTSI